MVRYTTSSARGKQVLRAETNWWLKTEELNNAKANLMNYMRMMDELRSLIDRQLSFITMFNFNIAMKLSIPPINFDVLNNLTWESILKAVHPGTITIKIDLKQAFMRLNMLPKELRNELLRLAQEFKELAEDIIKLATSTLEQIFASAKLLNLLMELEKYLSDAAKKILKELLAIVDALGKIMEDVAKLVELILKALFAFAFNSTRLEKGIYGKSKFDDSYYDPPMLIDFISKTWSGYASKDFSVAQVKEWMKITKKLYGISDNLTHDFYLRAINSSSVREEAVFADYAWLDVSGLGPEGLEPKQALAGFAVMSTDTLDIDNKGAIFTYKTDYGKEGWYGKSILGFVRLSKDTTLECWPTNDHAPTVVYHFGMEVDPPLYAEAGRATDLVHLGWFDVSYFDLANIDTDDAFEDIYYHDPWGMAFPLHITNTYVSLATVNLPLASSPFTALDGPLGGSMPFRQSSTKEYALPYAMRTELEQLAQCVVKEKIDNPTTTHITMATNAILQLFAIMTNPNRKQQYNALRALVFDEAVKYWKEYWAKHGLPEEVLNDLVIRAQEKLKSFLRTRLEQKLRARLYRKYGGRL